MKPFYDWYNAVEPRLVRWLSRRAILLLRLSLGGVYVVFGALKFFPQCCAAEPFAARTIGVLTLGVVEPAVSAPMLAVGEVIIGLGLISGLAPRATMAMFFVHMIGTLTPLAVLPEVVFPRPFSLSLEGLYVCKNVILFSAGLVLAATIRGGCWTVTDEAEVDPAVPRPRLRRHRVRARVGSSPAPVYRPWQGGSREMSGRAFGGRWASRLSATTVFSRLNEIASSYCQAIRRTSMLSHWRTMPLRGFPLICLVAIGGTVLVISLNDRGPAAAQTRELSQASGRASASPGSVGEASSGRRPATVAHVLPDRDGGAVGPVGSHDPAALARNWASYEAPGRGPSADSQGGSMYLKQSPAAIAPQPPRPDFGLGDSYVSELLPYPQPCQEGMRTPFDLWRYAGRGPSSWGSPQLRMPFDEWIEFHREQKPQLMEEVRSYMDSRYDFTGETIPGVTMSGGHKGVPSGPVARLIGGIESFEELAALTPEQIKEQDLFPYKPLAHPLQSTAHMLFPEMWLQAHPEHRRIDVDFDIPDAYLPEFPPPMFLTTHKELGDVTDGREVTLGNYYEIFDGLLTAEQMEGLKELLRPTPTTWFNHTEHRVTLEPSAGVSCFACHVNGHTNGAIELAPDSRPNEARLRVDTPTIRGNFNLMQLSSKRSIRSLDHFCEVEEYFDGDPGLMQAIGPRGAQRHITNRMGDLCAILDNPPAPKLGPLMNLLPEKATASELRGEALFHGKARCSQCHYGPAFVDDYLHDLQVERFYKGRPEGPIKTFPLRGIKDTPPYLHDGRCPTLHDAVEFFNIVLELKLTAQEKDDLVAYLLCL